MKNPIAVYPALLDKLRGVEGYEAVAVLEKAKISQIGKEIGLHDREAHRSP